MYDKMKTRFVNMNKKTAILYSKPVMALTSWNVDMIIVICIFVVYNHIGPFDDLNQLFVALQKVR